MTQRLIFGILSLAVALVISNCSRKVSLDQLLAGQSPYEHYVSSLKKASLQQTVLGKSWLAAGESSLSDSLLVGLPHGERGYFTADNPSALALRYEVQQGQAIRIELASNLADSVKLFLDVFAVNDPELIPIISADTLRTLAYEVERTGVHLLRLQPELLVSGGYDLRIISSATLEFPVAGKDRRAVGSFFGDPRDGGARSHRGIDIFAPRGTPVIAAHGGVVSPSMRNRLGGKVVWVSNLKKKLNQYYAHLDSQIVRPGQRVERGDTLGLVGNTGNAITTPPHLHFGIYSFGRGAVDPYPFVIDNPLEMPSQAADSSMIGQEARIQTELANIRQAPSTASSVLRTLAQHAPVRITAASGPWYRVELPEGTAGFAHESLVQTMNTPLSTMVITPAHRPYLSLFPQQPVPQLWEGEEVHVLARYQSAWYVETSAGERLWIRELT